MSRNIPKSSKMFKRFSNIPKDSRIFRTDSKNRVQFLFCEMNLYISRQLSTKSSYRNVFGVNLEYIKDHIVKGLVVRVQQRRTIAVVGERRARVKCRLLHARHTADPGIRQRHTSASATTAAIVRLTIDRQWRGQTVRDLLRKVTGH